MTLSELTIPVFNIQADEVLSHAEAFALESAVSSRQRALLQTALDGLRAQVKAWNPVGEDEERVALPPFVYVPLAVFAAIRGEAESAVPLAAAASLLFLGIDIFDDVADGDCAARWPNTSAAEMNLCAATLLSSLPQQIISDLEAPPETINRMQRTLAVGLLRMSAGQQGDLARMGSCALSVDEIIASVVAKSGEEVAMFARMAAELAGASESLADIYAEFGRCLGTAGQLSSDCYELFADAEGRDFRHGARTLPVALHLERLPEQERAQFLDLLERAREDERAREVVRETLHAGAVLRRCAFIVETYCQRALRAVEEARAKEPGRSDLLALVESITFFPKGEKR
jgi:geranylgeranyl pyrophosphate synthase